jgi:predicted NUDIX family NTP pyrophosphohydrolase
MELRIQGIIVNTFKKDWPQAFVEMHKYIQEVNFFFYSEFSNIKLKINCIARPVAFILSKWEHNNSLDF